MELRTIIKQYREEHNLSQREFAERCDNITHGYISMIENNLNKSTGKPPRPSVEKLESIAHGMNMELDELMEMMNGKKKPQLVPTPQEITLEHVSRILDGIINDRVNDRMRQSTIPGADTIPYTPPRARVPIIGVVRCGAGGLAFEDLQGAALAEVSNPSDYFYLRAEGDSMAPDIKPGDLVLVHIQPEVETGELAVIVVDGEEGMLKKYVRKDNAVILMSLNQEYPPRVFVGEEMNLVKVAGKVVESKRKY